MDCLNNWSLNTLSVPCPFGTPTLVPVRVPVAKTPMLHNAINNSGLEQELSQYTG